MDWNKIRRQIRKKRRKLVRKGKKVLAFAGKGTASLKGEKAGIQRTILLVFGLLVLIGGAAGGFKIRHAILEKKRIAAEEEQRYQEILERQKAYAAGAVYEEKDITLASTGSLFLHEPFLNSYAMWDGTYDFSEIFKFIRPYYQRADFMTCEFEGSLFGSNYSGYPMFLSPDSIVKSIHDSGVDLVNLASNHIYDGGSQGFQRTMDTLEKMEIPYNGIRQKKDDKKYRIEEIDGIRVGFMDYTYDSCYYTDGEYMYGCVIDDNDMERINGFYPNDRELVDQFCKEMEENVRLLKAAGVQFIVTQMHWGDEYQLEANRTQKYIAQRLCDMGVDAIIGGHTHCLEPIDYLQSEDGTHAAFVIYSEGNALSNQRKELLASYLPEGHTEDGVIVTLCLHQDVYGKVSLSDVRLTPTWVFRFLENGFSRYYILALDDVNGLEGKTGLMGIRADAEASYERTMDVLGPGLKKVKKYLSAERGSDSGGQQENDSTKEGE